MWAKPCTPVESLRARCSMYICAGARWLSPLCFAVAADGGRCGAAARHVPGCKAPSSGSPSPTRASHQHTDGDLHAEGPQPQVWARGNAPRGGVGPAFVRPAREAGGLGEADAATQQASQLHRGEALHLAGDQDMHHAVPWILPHHLPAPACSQRRAQAGVVYGPGSLRQLRGLHGPEEAGWHDDETPHCHCHEGGCPGGQNNQTSRGAMPCCLEFCVFSGSTTLLQKCCWRGMLA
jgi:hypothetical protein